MILQAHVRGSCTNLRGHNLYSKIRLPFWCRCQRLLLINILNNITLRDCLQNVRVPLLDNIQIRVLEEIAEFWYKNVHVLLKVLLLLRDAGVAQTYELSLELFGR